MKNKGISISIFYSILLLLITVLSKDDGCMDLYDSEGALNSLGLKPKMFYVQSLSLRGPEISAESKYIDICFHQQ